MLICVENGEHFVLTFGPANEFSILTLNGPIATKDVCFSRLVKCLRSLYGKQCGSSLFVSIHNSSVIFGNYLQQTISADDIFRCIFSWHFTG